jgi:hypothetical protein
VRLAQGRLPAVDRERTERIDEAALEFFLQHPYPLQRSCIAHLPARRMTAMPLVPETRCVQNGDLSTANCLHVRQ